MTIFNESEENLWILARNDPFPTVLRIFYYFFGTCEYKVQMAQRITVALTNIPTGSRDLLEFAFFVGVGFTAGSLGLI